MMKNLFILLFIFLFSTTLKAQQRGISKVDGPEQSEKKGRQFALLIGNNNYVEWDPLKTAIRDVERLRDVLLKRYGFRNNDIHIVRDATRVQILSGLDRLRKDSGADDKVLVYYAGHGVYDEGNDGYWVPVEGKLSNNYDHISNADILNRLGSIEARHKLLISDSCFSGNLLTRGVKIPRQSELEKPAYFVEKNRLKSVQGFSSGGNQPVYDGGPKWGGNSVFAYHLIAQLEANQRPFLSATELGQRVTEFVSNDTQSMNMPQVPIIQSIRNQGDQGGEFFFERPEKLSMTVGSVFIKPESGIINWRGETIRNVISGGIKKIGDGRDGVSWKYSQAKEGISIDALSNYMRKEGIDVLLTWQVDGKIVEEPSLLWQGMAYMDLEMNYYTLRGTNAELQDSFLIKGERLPIQDLEMSAAETDKHFKELTQKLVSSWEQNGAESFIRSIIE